MFLVADYWNEYSKIMNYKELRTLLIDELEEEIKENIEEKDIVNDNLKQLSELAKTDTQSVADLIESVESFGWKVIELHDLHCKLNSLRSYLANKNSDKSKQYIDSIDRVIQIIDDNKLLEE